MATSHGSQLSHIIIFASTAGGPAAYVDTVLNHSLVVLPEVMPRLMSGVSKTHQSVALPSAGSMMM